MLENLIGTLKSEVGSQILSQTKLKSFGTNSAIHCLAEMVRNKQLTISGF